MIDNVPVWVLPTICATSGGILLLIALAAIWRRLGKQKPKPTECYGVGTNGQRQTIGPECDYASPASWEAAQPAHKPIPYASPLPTGTGSKVDAPWVTREEFDELVAMHSRMRQREIEDGQRESNIVDRLDALEGGARGETLCVGSRWTEGGTQFCVKDVRGGGPIVDYLVHQWIDDPSCVTGDGYMRWYSSEATRRIWRARDSM